MTVLHVTQSLRSIPSVAGVQRRPVGAEAGVRSRRFAARALRLVVTAIREAQLRRAIRDMQRLDDRLLQDNPLLERSLRNRLQYLAPLNHVQVEMLKAHRADTGEDDALRGIQLTINGISAGLRNTG